MVELIPRRIHAVWYGNRLPENIRRRFERWRELNSDYAFKLWNESNSPLHIPYLRNALAEKHWSNASNFTRLWALYQEGGIYLDTDVDLLRPLDGLLGDACFLGFEASSLELDDLVNNAVLGAIPRHEFILSCLHALLGEFHGTEDANLSSPVLATRICRDYGLVSYGEQCLVRGRVRIYEKEVFYPIGFDDPKGVTEIIPSSSIAVHRWSASWCNQPWSVTQRALTRCFDILLFAILEGGRRFSSFRVILETALQSAARRHWLRHRSVAAGLFRGVSFSALGSKNPALPKILGTYKFVVQKTLAGLAVNQYSHIYNIGSDDGYLLVCIGTLFPSAQLLAYDIDSQACRAAEKNLRWAGMSGRFEVHNRPFKWSDLERSANRILMVCDIGGGEVELFARDRLPGRLPDDMIIELHDFVDPEAATKIASALRITHKIQIFGESALPLRWLDTLWGIPASAVSTFADERRPMAMRWLSACAL